VNGTGSAHLFIEFEDRFTKKKYTHEAFPWGLLQAPGVAAPELAETFATKHEESNQGNNKPHHQLFESTDKSECNKISQCLYAQGDEQVNNYDVIKKNFIRMNNQEFHYFNTDGRFVGIVVGGAIIGGVIGVIGAGPIGLLPGVIDGAGFGLVFGYTAWVTGSRHQNSNTAARLMAEKCLKNVTIDPWWFLPGWNY
jgi:hypothetical protein